MLCKKCDFHLCDSTEIRLIEDAHFVCVDERIWERCNARPILSQKVDLTFFKLAIPGKSYCIRCNNLLGNVIKYNRVYFPSLKADALLLLRVENTENTRPQKEVPKKWKKILSGFFSVERINESDVLIMCKNPPNSKIAMDKLLG